LYFYWDDKQKYDGVLLVNESVFNYFVDGKFTLTAKNANMYYGYEITPDAAYLIDGVYAYGIPKEIQFVGKNGKIEKDNLKNINMVFIDGNYKIASVELIKLWNIKGNNIPCDNLTNALVEFTGLKLGTNKIKIEKYEDAVYGKRITVAEIADDTFECLYVMLDGTRYEVNTVFDVDTQQALRHEFVFKAKQEGNTVTFVNKEASAKIVAKLRFVDYQGNRIAAPDHGLNEFFGDIGKINVGIVPYPEVWIEPELINWLMDNGYMIISNEVVTRGEEVDYDYFEELAEANDVEIGVIINKVEANRMYVVIFTFQAPKPTEDDPISSPVNVGRFKKITSYQHREVWKDIGIPFCWAGQMSEEGYGYILFDDNFFVEYESVTIRFKISGKETDVTFTFNGVDQDWIIQDEENSNAYNFTFDGGGMATIVSLMKWN
jgi:hypothetical protein